jgi:hypothetical protein
MKACLTNIVRITAHFGLYFTTFAPLFFVSRKNRKPGIVK